MKIPSLEGDWTITEDDKINGEKVMNNYKKSKAEQLVREAKEEDPDMYGGNGDVSMNKSRQFNLKSSMNSQMNTTGFSSQQKTQQNNHLKLVSEKMQEVSQFFGEPPDAERVLGEIFYGKEGKMFDLNS
jgi:hypothetical protein